MNNSKSRLAEIIDSIFLKAFILILSFLLIRSLTGFVQSVAAAVAVTFVIGYFIKYRTGSKKFSFAETKRMNELFDQLIFGGENFCLDFFNKLLSSKMNAEINDNFIKLKKTLVYCKFSIEPLTASDLLTICANADKNFSILIINAYGIDKKASSILEKLPVKTKILYGEKLFGLMNICNMFPDSGYKPETKKKRSLKKILGGALDRKLFRRYLTAALILAGMSYIMPYSIYYLVMAVITASLSVLCLFNFKKPVRKR